ncbi:unnamed protein product [Paramecium sonneborni]|uniref:Uncharacterized protein n=1 Tax=Paramecium sonneborni TaxID=65129 RepID=A0A8S1RVE2_9CILI|nr:unnamed protein product [Paramecium sonneborni]
MVIMTLSCQSAFRLIEQIQYLVVEITLSVSGIFKQDNKKPNQMVIVICFSPDSSTLASGSSDNSIRLWDINTRQQFSTLNQKHKNLAQFQIPFNLINTFEKNTFINILLISQQAIFQAKGALIYKGKFENQSGIDLKTLLYSKKLILFQVFIFRRSLFNHIKIVIVGCVIVRQKYFGY